MLNKVAVIVKYCVLFFLMSADSIGRDDVVVGFLAC